MIQVKDKTGRILYTVERQPSRKEGNTIKDWIAGFILFSTLAFTITILIAALS
jgi:hypothetical protein